MNSSRLLISTVFILLLNCCGQKTDYKQLSDAVRENLNTGNFTQATKLADSIKAYCTDIKLVRSADSLIQIAERIRLDFSVNEEQLKRDIEKRTGYCSETDKSFWEENGWLEWRIIDGEKMYFNRAASNLVLIKRFHDKNKDQQVNNGDEPYLKYRLKHTEEVFKLSANNSDPVVPVSMKINYTITVIPDAVPDGEIIRCWMPWPKSGHPRQKNIRLLSTSAGNYNIAPDSAIHSTLYMETRASAGKPTVFQLSFQYLSSAQHFNISDLSITPYNKESQIYRKFTAEQLPHICFTGNVKRLADSITSPGDKPEEIVGKVYRWFKDNITWTGALEYSTMPDIPEYVYMNRRGDCGMQTFLFMSLLRYKGIPVRWQSGWMMPPDAENLHDWCEVYYEGAGWIPVDISYNIQPSEINAVKEFYLSGIDSYRMIVNDGISGLLYPAKKFMRSEPYDFQRGEVEWSGGNLYFDKWDYDMKIDYVK